MLPTRFVLLSLRAADSGGELGVTWQAVAVPLAPVVGVTAVPDAFPAAGSRQGQWGTLRAKTKKRQSKYLTSSERLLHSARLHCISIQRK